MFHKILYKTIYTKILSGFSRYDSIIVRCQCSEFPCCKVFAFIIIKTIQRNSNDIKVSLYCNKSANINQLYGRRVPL